MNIARKQDAILLFKRDHPVGLDVNWGLIGSGFVSRPCGSGHKQQKQQQGMGKKPKVGEEGKTHRGLLFRLKFIKTLKM